MTDTARVLLTAAVLSASGIGLFAWRLAAADPTQPDRIVGELRLAQGAALILALMGGVSVGLATGSPAVPAAHLDATLGIAFVVVAGVILTREPHEALLIAAAAFVLHALTDVAHRPGLLPDHLPPRWWIIGSAVYDMYLAVVCYWIRRR